MQKTNMSCVFCLFGRPWQQKVCGLKNLKNITFEVARLMESWWSDATPSTLYALWVFYWSVYEGINSKWRKGWPGGSPLTTLKTFIATNLWHFITLCNNGGIYISYKAIISVLCEALVDYWYICCQMTVRRLKMLTAPYNISLLSCWVYNGWL